MAVTRSKSSIDARTSGPRFHANSRIGTLGLRDRDLLSQPGARPGHSPRQMSSWANVSGLPSSAHDYAALSANNLAADMSGMLDDGSAGMMNGLDMNINMAMDMDLDYGQDMQSQNPMQQQQRQQRQGGQPINQSMSVNATNGTHSSQTQHPDGSLSGGGAGPLPTGFGMSAPSNSSTLTEFTKRRNWSQRIIEELKDFLHIVTPDGRILWVSPSCKAITGYDASMLVGKFIAEFVHPDDSGIFMREFNESIASGNTLRFFYRFKKDDGTYMIFECDGHPHISPEAQSSISMGTDPNHNSVTGVCRGFFMMARPYPTRNAALLDSFLEHKIENERLMKRIEELKREEAEETAEQDRLYREHVAASNTGGTASESNSRAPAESTSEANVDYQGMPPPAKPPISNTALTRQNLDSALSAQKPDSIADKMSRYEANSTHLESIELLTGLRYRDGERSHGISTGDTSPALIRGDAGIAILVDRDRDGPKKDKKKLKVADEYVCADCGTLDSPEWRKGPRGPKTLCNACGLRWAKKEKKDKRNPGDDTPVSSPLQGPHMSGSGGNGAGGMQRGVLNLGPISQPPGLKQQGSGSSGK